MFSLANQWHELPSLRKIERIKVGWPHHEHLLGSLRAFSTFLENKYGNRGPWEPVLSHLSRQVFFLSNSLLTIDEIDIIEGLNSLERITNFLVQWQQLLSRKSDEARSKELQIFKKIASQYSEIAKQPLPLVTEILGILDSAPLGNTALITPILSTAKATQAKLKQLGISTPVCTPRDLRDSAPLELLVILGVPQLYSRIGQEWILSSPPAKRCVNLHLSHIPSSQPRRLSMPSQSSPYPVHKQNGDTVIEAEFVAAAESIEVEPLPHFIKEISVKNDDACEEHGSCEALLLDLPENQIVLLETDGSSIVVNPRALDTVTNSLSSDLAKENETELLCLDSWSERIPHNALEAGQFILLKTSGAGDLITSVADLILGPKSSRLREAQSTWKSYLRKSLNEKGTEEIIKQLSMRGGENLEAVNIRNWSSSDPRVIRPRSDQAFRAILDYVGFPGEKSQSFFTDAIEIKTAHKQAGFQIRRELFSALEASDLSALYETGRMEVRRPGVEEGASFTLVRIDRIYGGSHHVLESLIGKIQSKPNDQEEWLV